MKQATCMSEQELFSEDSSVRNSSIWSETDSGSDSGSPPAGAAFSVGNFFSKKRQRCDSNTSTSGGSNEQQQQQKDVDGGSMDKRRRKKRHALQCVTPNRCSSTNSVPVESSSATLPSTRCANGNQPNQQGDNVRSEHVEKSFTSPPVQSTSPVPNSNADVGVKSALQEITSLLNTVVQRVERIENELKNSPSSSSDSATPSRKVLVPLVVRVSCYTCISCLGMAACVGVKFQLGPVLCGCAILCVYGLLCLNLYALFLV